MDGLTAAASIRLTSAMAAVSWMAVAASRVSAAMRLVPVRGRVSASELHRVAELADRLAERTLDALERRELSTEQFRDSPDLALVLSVADLLQKAPSRSPNREAQSDPPTGGRYGDFCADTWRGFLHPVDGAAGREVSAMATYWRLRAEVEDASPEWPR